MSELSEKENEIISQALLDVAGKMVIAARTAPKTRGRETLSIPFNHVMNCSPGFLFY